MRYWYSIYIEFIPQAYFKKWRFFLTVELEKNTVTKIVTLAYNGKYDRHANARYSTVRWR